MSVAPILSRTPLAATVFVDDTGKKNIRVYFQDPAGNVKETYFRQGDGWHTRPKNHVGKATLNNGLAVTSWNHGKEIRVYYLGADSKLVERCYSGGAAGEWYDGELTGKYEAAPYGQISAISFQHGDVFRIRIYFQGTDDKVHELCRDNQNPWTLGAEFPVTVKGTCIASSCLAARPNYIWLFFQTPDLKIIEYLYQGSGSWKQGIFQSQLLYDPGAYIAVSSFGKDSHRVFSITRDNKLVVTAFDGPANNWKPTTPITDQIPFGSLGAIPVAGEGEPEPAVRIYNQRKPSEITEWGTYDGTTYKEIIPSLPIS